MEGQTLPQDLAKYKKEEGGDRLRSEAQFRRKEKEAAGLFKNGRLMEGIRLMEDLIDYSLEMRGFDQLASRKAMMQHI